MSLLCDVNWVVFLCAVFGAQPVRVFWLCRRALVCRPVLTSVARAVDSHRQGGPLPGR